MSQDPKGRYKSNGFDFVPQKNDTYPFIDPKKLNLKGRNVLVTGASKGIGRATSLSFAAAGASGIVIAARSDLSSLVEELERKAESCEHDPPKIVTLELDVTNRKSVDENAEKVRKELGHLDIVILNAGVLEKFTPIVDSDPDIWWKTWQTNIYGCYLGMRAFTPLLVASPNPEKTIVGVSSVGAHEKGAGGSAYRTTKLALLRLMEVLSEENADKDVLAFSVHPGGVATELALELPGDMHSLLGDSPELSGDSIAWLTGERKDWLAGRYISCQWDMEKLLERKDEIVEADLLKVRMAVNA